MFFLAFLRAVEFIWGLDVDCVFRADHLLANASSSVVYDLSGLGKEFEWTPTPGVEHPQLIFDLRASNCFKPTVKSKHTTCHQRQGMARPATAVQWEQDGTTCHRLGDFHNADWGLIDTSNPEAGIRLEFTGGDPCGALGPRRSTLSLYISWT